MRRVIEQPRVHLLIFLLLAACVLPVVLPSRSKIAVGDKILLRDRFGGIGLGVWTVTAEFDGAWDLRQESTGEQILLTDEVDRRVRINRW